MVVISFGKDLSRQNVRLLVITTIVILMVSFDPIDCAMTAWECVFKLVSAKDFLRLINVTLADDHIRASTEQTFLDADRKFDALKKHWSTLTKFDAHDNIPLSYETIAQEMDDAISRLPSLASLDPFMAQVLDKFHNWIKPFNKWYFKFSLIGKNLTKNPASEASTALDDHRKLIKAPYDALVVLDSALEEYRNKWKQTQVRPVQTDQKPVLDAVEVVNKAVKEHLADFIDGDDVVNHHSPLVSKANEQANSWFLLGACFTVLAVLILLVAVAVAFFYRKKRSNRSARPAATSRSTSTRSTPTDSSARVGLKK